VPKEVLVVEVFEAIRGRRSIRRFTDQPLPKEALDELLEAARWAPCGGNLQRWRFVVVTSPSTKELIKKFAPGIFDMPAAFIVVCVQTVQGKHHRDEATYLADCSMAAENIMLQAHAMGIGTCVALSYAKVAIRRILNIPEDVEPMLLITLGYPAEQPEAPPKLTLPEIAFLDEYGKEWK
jgi:nitroreductase